MQGQVELSSKILSIRGSKEKVPWGDVPLHLEMCQEHGTWMEGEDVCASIIRCWPHVPFTISRWCLFLVSFLRKVMINVWIALPPNRLFKVIQGDRID